MLLKPFNQIDKSEVSLCGGKATSLGFMIQNGFVIPDGFVVTTEAFDLYKNVAEPLRFHSQTLFTLINQIYDAFDSLNCKHVAVRSSATSEDSADFSFAGQFDTFLNVEREYLIEKVFECFEGLNSPRCQAYMSQTDLDVSKIKVAVVIQSMVQSQVAGVAFTVHPVTKNRDQILIEAGFGLGEAVVSGQITPDSYLVDKNNLDIIEIDVSNQNKGLFLSTEPEIANIWQEIPKEKQNQQKLSNPQIQELAKTCIEIEKLYGFACDIEWALVEGQIFILQCRAVTTC